MKAIASINFKGGVGKTTIIWLLAKYIANKEKKKVLVVDADAQMSLTLAISIEESGGFQGSFGKWYDSYVQKKETIFDALEQYDLYARGKNRHFDFPIGSASVYQLSSNLHFVPSVVDLYWLELEVFDRVAMKDFVGSWLGKLQHAKALPSYDFVFFDCPPSFSLLSYSVLNSCSLVLMPVNPDVFASRGVRLMVDGMKLHISPWPDPAICVFMNKAGCYLSGIRAGQMHRDTIRYQNEVKGVANQLRVGGTNIAALDSFIPQRVNIGRAIRGAYFPDDFEEHFERLWDETRTHL